MKTKPKPKHGNGFKSSYCGGVSYLSNRSCHTLCALRPSLSHFRRLARILFSLYSSSYLSFDPSMAAVTGSSISISLNSCSFKQNQALTRLSNSNSVSLSINGKCFPSLRLRSAPSRFRISCVAKPETVDKVCEIVRKQLALPADSAVTGESKFAALGADSLDTVEIVMGLEEEFGISVEEESAQSITTVQDAADLIEKLIEKKSA